MMSTIKVLGIFTDGMSAVTNGANTGSAAATGNVAGLILGGAQTVQALCGVARIGGATVGALGFPLSIAAAYDSYNSYQADAKAGNPIQQADYAGMIGGAAGTAGGAILILEVAGAAGALSVLVVPLALLGVAAGSYQFASSLNGWTAGEGNRPITAEENAAINSFLKNNLPATSNYLKDLFLPPLSLSEECKECLPKPNSETNTKWRDGVTFQPRDPLAIDLTGDGIQTVAINPAAHILFDHNGDGAKTATGWLQGSDAWLVHDISGNGTIDSGLELFGVDTDITVGGVTRKATNGFEALAALDSNGDKIFDAKDTAFAQVRLWQDLDQDGISDTGELSTLDAKGIVSVSLNYTSTSTNLGGGNSITGKAVVTRTTGSSEIDSVSVGADSTANNLNLADNPFYREFTETVELTSAASTLPNMGGSGAVRDLRDAMSLTAPQGSGVFTSARIKQAAQDLTSTVQAFATATTRDQQRALLDNLVQQWGKTANLDTADNQLTSSSPGDRYVQSFAQSNPTLYRKIVALEQFNGTSGLSQVLTRFSGTLPDQVVTLFESAYTALRESVYQGLVLQTRLKPYFDALTLDIGEQGINFDRSKLIGLLEDKRLAAPNEALADLAELASISPQTLNSVGFDGLSLLQIWRSELPNNPDTKNLLARVGIAPIEATNSLPGQGIYIGDGEGNRFQGGSESNEMSGGGGNDALSGGGGDDFISGGSGDDVIYGEEGNDVLGAQSGKDFLWGGLGDDTLVAGTGTSNLYGGLGKDTYVISGPIGSCTIVEQWGDPSDVNTIYISGSIKREDVRLVAPPQGTLRGFYVLLRDGIDGSIFFQENFGDNIPPPDQINIVFSDGTTLTRQKIRDEFQKGTAKNDLLVGSASNDHLIGGDTITLSPYASNYDSLYGGAGNDTLDGGAGDDILFGEAGEDTYMFGIGSGNDTIYNSSGDQLNAFEDNILLGEGITTENLVIQRDWSFNHSNDLILSIT